MQNKHFFQRFFRGRRSLVLFLSLALLLAAGGAFRHFTDAERYRPLIEAELSRLFGVPVTIRALELVLLPTPHLLGYDVCIGEEEFRLESPVVEARARLRALVRRQVIFTSIDGDGAVMVLPADDREFVSKWDSFFKNFDPPSDKKPARIKFTFFIDQIRTPGLIVRRGNDIALHGNVTAEKVISPSPRLIIEGLFPFFGETTRVEADLSFPRYEDGLTHLEGNVRFDDIFLDELAGIPSAPDFRFGMQLAVRGELPEDLSADIEGKGRLGGQRMSQSGGFDAKAWWRENQLIINDAKWRSPGFEITGDATWTPGAGVACRLPAAQAAGEGLAALLAAFSGDSVTFSPEDDAQLSVKDLVFGVDGDTAPRLVSGEILFTGVDVLAQIPGAPERREAYDAVSGRIRVDEGAFMLDEITAPGMAFSGRIAPTETVGSFHFDFTGEMTLSPERLAPWMEVDAIERLEGQLAVSRLYGTTLPEGGLPGDFTLEARLSGLNLSIMPPGATVPVAFDGINGGLAFSGGALRLENIAGKGIEINGTIGLGADPEGQPFDLEVQADLAGPLPRFLWPDESLKDIRGTAVFTRLRGHYVPEQALPRDLSIEGRIEEGGVMLDLPGFQDTLQKINAVFTSDGESVTFDGNAAADKLGAFKAQGKWTLSNQTLTGMLSADWTGLGKIWRPEGAAGDYVAAALTGFGPSELDLTIALPESANAPLSLGFQRRGEPALQGKMTLSRGAEGLRPASLSVETQLPLAWFIAVLPETVQAEGDALLRLHQETSDSPYLLSIALDNAVLRAGAYLTKQAGDPAAIILEGQLSGAEAGLSRLELQYLGESLVLRQDATGFQSDRFQIHLAPLVRLLPEGATASGTVSGSFAMEPFKAELRFDAAALALSEALGLDRVDGALSYADGFWQCRNLHVQGADSDCYLNADRQDGSWKGSITGTKLNLNTLEAMYDAFASWVQTDEEETAPRDAPDAEILVDIGALFYRRAQIDTVQTRIELKQDGIEFQDLILRPYGGEVKGTARLAYASGEIPRQAHLNIEMIGVDARLIDELFFPEPRGLLGSVEAAIDLRFPTGPGVMAQNGMTGTVHFTARNGTYGKIGFATKLLTALRTTEIIRLRIPTLKDEGLVFDLSEGRLVMQEGVMTIESAELTGKAYALTASGTADFPKDATDVVIYVYTLESVTGIVSAVPILGRGVDILKGTTALRARATGPPLDVNVRLETPAPVRGLVDRISR
jgi:hypothetical protein